MNITFKEIDKEYLEVNREKISTFINRVNLNDICDYKPNRNTNVVNDYQSYLDKSHLLFIALNEKNEILGICSCQYWDNDRDVIFDISTDVSNLLVEIYPLFYKEIQNNFPNIKNVYTEVYKSNPQQLEIYQDKGFAIYEDESKIDSRIKHPLILIRKKLK